jgi:alanine racemase
VSASHVIVELVESESARGGDVATLIGADPVAVSPNEVASAAEASVYDIFMHLNPMLPRYVI